MSENPVNKEKSPDVILNANVPIPGPASMPVLDGMPQPGDVFAYARNMLVTYQQTFIAAQASYIHTKDVSEIVEAQHGFIIDLLTVIEAVSKSELGEVQEQIIALLQTKLHQVDVVS